MLGAELISSQAAITGPHTPDRAATVGSDRTARVREMAKEFEATFVSMLLKEMRQTLDEDGGGLFPGDSGDVQGGLFDLYLGRHLADSGGVGMAATLIRQIQAADAAIKTSPQRPPMPTNASAPASTNAESLAVLGR